MGRFLFALGLFLIVACDGPEPSADAGPDGGPSDSPPPAPFAGVEESARFELPGLRGHAHVVRTEMNVPHVYAENRVDAMRVLGFVMAQDRFFQMDMTRRLSQGRISEVLGDAALETDIENRQTGGGFVTQLFLDGLSDEEAAELDAFAEGINAYIEAVRQRRLDPPKEYAVAYSFLGARTPVDLMKPWTRRDVVATGATVLYSTSFESGDIGRAQAHARFEAEGEDYLPEGARDRVLRLDGIQKDIIEQYAPPNDSSSAAGWGLETGNTTRAPLTREGRAPMRPRPLRPLRVERSVLERLGQRLANLERRWHRDGNEGYGSNAWAVMGSVTPDGAALLAGDGHLQLSVPSLFWQFGLDTELMGEGSDVVRLLGATIPGLPAMGVGTNGRIAWTQTAYFADVTDWYEEVIVLDDEGMPRASLFRGEERPLDRYDEQFTIANVPLLGSVGRTETIPRWTTFDGRWITSIEGRPTTADEPLEEGESRVNMMGDWIVPADIDGDGRISAISFYYGPFDGGTLLRAFRLFTFANDVEDFRQAMRHFIGYGGSMVAADADGSVVYSAYHAVPCRDHLRDLSVTDRIVWAPGADPRRLIDGTQYGAWKIPLDAEGRVDEEAAATGGPTACAVPFDDWPQAVNPARQYVHHANNDPAHIATDNDLFDDPYYIGGPWLEGYRARRIEQRLQEAIAEGRADIDEMARIQGDHHSNLGEDWVPFLLEVIAAAREAASEDGLDPDSPKARMSAQWQANQAAYEDVEARMIAWRDAGYPTPSGVKTFYSPAPSAEERANAVATTIFAHWFPRFIQGVLDDEGIDRNLSPAVTGDTYRTQTIQLLVRGRGEGNPLELGSWSPETRESVFFDDVRTPEVESSQEIGLRALDQALEFLRSEPSEPGVGGFGTDDADQWLWGLRHQVRFESLLADFLGDDPNFGFLVDNFSITTSILPLGELEAGDPREGLRWFPRPGDQFDVDAANPGLGGTRFTHGSGPVFRMVIALGPDGVRGRNIIPGGQSGLPDSPHFADQARLWLANETLPMRYLPEEVAEGAVSRERFVPAP